MGRTGPHPLGNTIEFHGRTSNPIDLDLTWHDQALLGMEYLLKPAQMLARESEERLPARTVFSDILVCHHKGVSGYPCLRQNGA